MMRPSVAIVSTLLLIVTSVAANVEKIIFLAPPPIRLPEHQLGLEQLQLSTLSPETQLLLPTKLSVAFPTESSPRGISHWYILNSLREGQRYELRVCWPATQPTEFWLNVHTLTEAFETPELITSLAKYSQDHLESGEESENAPKQDYAGNVSLLFLHVQAAADYYSLNRTLMLSPPQVDVDLILDPYLLNIFPQSLVPTGLYIVVVAVIAVYVSKIIAAWLSDIAKSEDIKPHKD